MSNRYISLFYGSFNFKVALKCTFIYMYNYFTSFEKLNIILSNIIKKHFIGVAGIYSFNSGRAALAACLKARGIKEGDEVLLSAYTCLAVPTAIISTGAKPIYIDLKAGSLNISIELILSAINPNVKAIIIQHTLGSPAEIIEIISLLSKSGILIIEDCALSIGSKINDKYLGTFADAAIFSMELSKTLSCGWGGILLINNQQFDIDVELFYNSIANRNNIDSNRDFIQTIISSICYHPKLLDIIGKYIVHIFYKTNIFRKSTPILEYQGIISGDFIQKIGKAQLIIAIYQWKRFKEIITICEQNTKFLQSELMKINYNIIGLPTKFDTSVTPRVSFLHNDRNLLIQYFLSKNIELGSWFDGPLSPLPSSTIYNYNKSSYPIAEQLSKLIINIPSHSRLTKKDLTKILLVFKELNNNLILN